MKKSMKMKGGCMDTSVTVLLIIVFAVAVIALAYYFMYVYNKHSTPTQGPTVMPTIASAKLMMKEHFTSSELTPADNEIVVALFAADEWCGYCKQYAPVWEKITAANKGKQVNGKKVRFVKVDCSKPENTPKEAEELGVKGYPTLVAIPSSGSPKHLEGRNSMEEIEAQLKSL
jgi:thiol-disulfide isomerase/thioredoxin